MSLGRKHRKPADDTEHMPKTVEQAVALLLSSIPESDRKLIQETRREDLIRFHHSWGQGIRNDFGLWGRNQALIQDLPPDHRWPDNASTYIIELVWERLLQRSPQDGNPRPT